MFLDDNIMINKKRLYLLIDAIKRKGLHKKVTFTFQARGDNIEYDICRAMYDAGFRTIIFGLEAASEDIMKSIKKGETVSGCIRAVKIMKELNFTVGATYIFGLPGETHKDRMDCVRLTKSLDIDIVRYNNAIPYPGTEFFEIAKSEGRLDLGDKYDNFVAVSGITENPFKSVPFAYVPNGTTGSQLRRDILLAHISIYSDIPRTIKNIFTSAHSANWFSLGHTAGEAIKKTLALVPLFLFLICKYIQCFYYIFLKKETALPIKSVINILFEKKGFKDV